VKVHGKGTMFENIEVWLVMISMISMVVLGIVGVYSTIALGA